MVDFRVDDGFQWHPKTAGMSLAAIGLWTLAGTWCARYLTDGYIPGDILRGMAGRQRNTIQELIDRNLLLPLGDGYQFHDWLQYQRSKQEVTTELAAARERMRKLRARRRGDDPT